MKQQCGKWKIAFGSSSQLFLFWSTQSKLLFIRSSQVKVERVERMFQNQSLCFYLLFNYLIIQNKLMIFKRLMTSKIIFTFFLTIIVQAQHDDHDDHGSMTAASAWGFGVLAGAGIFVIGLLAALLVVLLRNCISEKSFKVFRSLLSALGCGALVGDAIVHLLPEAFKSAEVNTNIAALIFISAIMIFILIERVFACCGITHKHEENSEQEQGHEGREVADVNDSLGKIQNAEFAESAGVIDAGKPKNEETKKSSDKSRQTDESQSRCCDSWNNLKGKSTPGYLIFASEFLHKFFDGFALGVAFSSRDSDKFIPLMIAVYAHEIPCTIGVVGIFLKSKFTSYQTVFCNSLINFTGLLGAIIGLGIGNISESALLYILTFVAGNFIFIGANIWRNIMKHKSSCVNVMEFVSFSLGVGAMYLILLAESEEGGHAH